jgi:hypothetical protein
MYYSSSYGSSWSAYNTNNNFKSVKGSADLTKLIATTGVANSVLWQSDSSGFTWYPANLSPSTQWQQVATDQYRKYAVGSVTGSSLQHNTNPISTGVITDHWTASTGGINTPGSWNSLQWHTLSSSADGRYVYVTTQSQGSYISRDGGKTFGTQTVTCWGCLSYSGEISGNGQVLVFTQNSYAVASTVSYDNGVNWSDLPSNANSAAWQDVALSYAGDRIYGIVPYPGGGIYYGSSGTYAQSNVNGYLTGDVISCSGDGAYVLATIYTYSVWPSYPSGVLRSTNYGASFDVVGASVMTGSRIYSNLLVSSTGQFMSVFSTGGDTFISSDYGVNWVGYNNLPSTWANKNFSVVKGSADLSKLVATFGGNNNDVLWLSDDRGVTWYASSSPTTLWQQVCTDANRKYIVGAGYGVAIQHNDNPF